MEEIKSADTNLSRSSRSTWPSLELVNNSSTKVMFVGVQSLSHVWLFVTPWTVACQAPLSSTISWSLLKFMSIESMIQSISSSANPFSFCLQSFPTSRSSPMSQLFALGGQNIGASASASVLPMNVQDWFSSELTCLISFQCKGLSRAFSNSTVQKHQSFGPQLSLWSNSLIHTWLLEKP